MDNTAIIRRLFRNRFQHFRAGWRMLFCLGMVLVCFAPVAGLLKIWDLVSPDLGQSGFKDELISVVNIVFYIGLNTALILGTWITLRWIDKRPYSLLGLDFNLGGLRDFARGFALGGANILAAFIVLRISGLVTVRLSPLKFEVLSGMMVYFLFFTVAALMEEILNRGYFFQALIEGTRTWIAVLFISSLFILGHMTNTGFNWTNGTFFFLHGIIYCLLYITTRSVWVPFGFHLSWNWIQGSVLGLNVSGSEIKNSLFLAQSRGPDIWSGGEFGPEGSLITILISILFIVYILKSKWLKPDPSRLELWRNYPAGFGLAPEKAVPGQNHGTETDSLE